MHLQQTKILLENASHPITTSSIASTQETSVWNNVVIAYSKCNEHESTWRAGLAQKKLSLQQLIREISGTSVEVPVFTLGGAEAESSAENAGALPTFSDSVAYVLRFCGGSRVRVAGKARKAQSMPL